jgi:hypothetical protein
MIGRAGILYVMGFAVILGIMGWNMNRYSVSSTGNMEAYVDGAVSHNLAVAGANVALAKFYNNHAWPGNMTQYFHLPGLKGTAIISLATSGTTAILTSISSYSSWWASGGTVHDTIRVFFDVNDTSNFAMYAWYTGFSGNDQFWYNGDSVWGPIRSNGGLHVMTGPVATPIVFNGKVLYAKNITGPGTPQYMQGPPSKTVGVPLPSDLSELSNAAASGGKVYTGDVDVSFNAGSGTPGDGSVIFRNSATKAVLDSFALGASGFNGAVWVNGDVHMTGSGKVDGKLSIGSTNNIFIQGGGVRYEQDPLLGPSEDVLGLMATNSVTVGKNLSASDPANWPNCRIDAGILALNGGFNAPSPGGVGTLTVTGCIVEGSTGDVMGSNGKNGYLKSYHWDARYASSTYRPPFFPGFGPKTYRITNWWESPRVRPPLSS